MAFSIGSLGFDGTTSTERTNHYIIFTLSCEARAIKDVTSDNGQILYGRCFLQAMHGHGQIRRQISSQKFWRYYVYVWASLQVYITPNHYVKEPKFSGIYTNMNPRVSPNSPKKKV